MNNKYLTYYFKNLCVETFPAYGKDMYYDMCIYNHFFEILLRLGASQKDFNYLVFVDNYIQKLEGKKYKNKFENISKINYENAKEDFLKLLSNIHQITLIYNHKSNHSDLEEKLHQLDDSRLEEYANVYNLSNSTVDLIRAAVLKVSKALSLKINFEYDMKTYDRILSATLKIVETELMNLTIDDIVSKRSKEVDRYQKRVFKENKEEVLVHFELLSAAIKDTFYNKNKVRHLSNVDYYLSFLLHDKVIPLKNSKIFKNFYEALYYAYKMSIYFVYFKNKYEKATLKEVIEFFSDEDLKVGVEDDYIDKRLKHIFFNIIANMNVMKVRQDFKHLPLIILGSQLSLDAKTIEKISVKIDNYTSEEDNKTKNRNVATRFKDLKYSTNTQGVYDLDEDFLHYIEMFNSYKIEAVYEVSIFDDEGELEIVSFDSPEEYRKYLSPEYEESEIEYMVETFLRKRDKKVYYEPLFEAL